MNKKFNKYYSDYYYNDFDTLFSDYISLDNESRQILQDQIIKKIRYHYDKFFKSNNQMLCNYITLVLIKTLEFIGKELDISMYTIDNKLTLMYILYGINFANDIKITKEKADKLIKKMKSKFPFESCCNRYVTNSFTFNCNQCLDCRYCTDCFGCCRCYSCDSCNNCSNCSNCYWCCNNKYCHTMTNSNNCSNCWSSTGINAESFDTNKLFAL